MPYPTVTQGSSPDSSQLILRRFGRVFAVLFAVYGLVWIIFIAVNPNGPDLSKRRQSERWIATSKSWLDRASCRRLGICGGSNWLLSTRIFHARPELPRNAQRHDHTADWVDHAANPNDWSNSERNIREIPEYVFQHAPFIYLHHEERWWPSDVADFLHHVEQRYEGQPWSGNVSLPGFDTLIRSGETSEQTYLQSIEDPETMPDWLTNSHNMPITCQDESNLSSIDTTAWPVNAESCMSDRSKNVAPESAAVKKSHDFLNLDLKMTGRSKAPAILIIVAKENNTLDAFWFFFYAFNRGAKVTGIQYGNHVGDWEHVLVRFVNAKPQSVFLSAHEWGSAYSFTVLEKFESRPNRPVVYAGLGSHAHYATSGKHAYALPLGLLGDVCERGRLWDPTKNLISYIHRPHGKGYPEDPRFLASMRNPRARSSWLEFKGRWGDPRFPLNDPQGRNYRFAGEYKYLDGPTGPWDKALDRKCVCEHAEKPCLIRDTKEGYVGPIKGFMRVDSLVS